MKKGNSVVIDNTNPCKEDRKYFTDLAKKYGWKFRCFRFVASK
jgi:predicted kinase